MAPNLAGEPKAPAQWRQVRLLLVRGVAEAKKPQPGQNDYALFLTTKWSLTPKRILE
ncbi:MAG TPA: hypothetical protein VLU73_14770 [Methylococcaceae bacterium]|nr:hypothetical protein [Methylococcaceae bacterium]